MELMPILSTLRRHKTAASLIVVEIALAAAVICNALHLIATRVERLQHDTGLPEAELLVIDVGGTRADPDADATSARDLAALRALPGVRDAALVNQVVYGNNSNNTRVRVDPGDKSSRLAAAYYNAGERGLATLGLKLVEGRDFNAEEFVTLSVVLALERPPAVSAIVTRVLAEQLFPGQPALGRVIYAVGDTPSTIVGVVEALPHPFPGRTDNRGAAILLPGRPSYRTGVYMLRADPAQHAALIRSAGAAIEAVDPSRIVGPLRPVTEMRRRFYAQDRAMVVLMGGVIVALVIVTALGIVGLASFWVAQRTRMIGTRRALGATRAQVRGYFQLENFILASAGVALGMGGAVLLGIVLMRSAEMPPLPWVYLPAGAVVLWLLGQAAVLAPAMRAAALPPAAVLRSG